MSQVRIIENPLIYWAFCVPSCFSRRCSQIRLRGQRRRSRQLREQLVSSSLPTFSEPSPIEFLSRSTFAPPRSVPRLTRFRTRSHEALGKTTCTRKSTILPNDTAIIPQSGFALQGGQVSPVWGNFRPNRQKPLILLGHFDFSPAKRPLKKNFFSPVFTPAAARRARPHAPPRAFSRLFAHRVSRSVFSSLRHPVHQHLADPRHTPQARDTPSKRSASSRRRGRR